MAQSMPLYFFPLLQSQGRAPDFFSARTQNGQLVVHLEIFAEFDKKCIGSELMTAPLTRIMI